MTNYLYNNLKDTAKQEDRNPLNSNALTIDDIRDGLNVRRFVYDKLTGEWVTHDVMILGNPFRWSDRYGKGGTRQDNILAVDVVVIRYSGAPMTREVWRLSDMGIIRSEMSGGWNPGSYTLRRPITA